MQQQLEVSFRSFFFFFYFIMICHICHPFALRGRNFHSPSALKEPSVYLSYWRKMRAFSPTALINVRLHGSVEYIRGPTAQGLLTPGLAWERSKFTSTFASAHVKAKKQQISVRGRKKTFYVDADVAFFFERERERELYFSLHVPLFLLPDSATLSVTVLTFSLICPLLCPLLSLRGRCAALRWCQGRRGEVWITLMLWLGLWT